MQLHSGNRPTVGTGRVVRNAESATNAPSLCSCIVGTGQSLVAGELSAMRSPQAPTTFRRSQDLTTARHFRRSPRADSGKMSTFARDHHPSLCSCIVRTDQPLVLAELSAMRSPQAPTTFRLSQDLTTARHFRRSPRADSGKMSTFARDHHPSLCSCIVGADQPLVLAELSAMRSPQAAQFCTNRQNAPGLHSPTWGNAGALSIRTKPAGPEGPGKPAEHTSGPTED